MKIVIITRDIKESFGEIIETWGIDDSLDIKEIEKSWRKEREIIYSKWLKIPYDDRVISGAREELNKFTLGKYIENEYGGELLYFDNIDL